MHVVSHMGQWDRATSCLFMVLLWQVLAESVLEFKRKDVALCMAGLSQQVLGVGSGIDFRVGLCVGSSSSHEANLIN